MGVIRVLPDEDIEDLLKSAIVGRIACCDHGSVSDGRPYLVPLAFGYDGEALYAHSGPGRKIRLMRTQPLVTIEVDHATAPDRWQSVVAEGTYEEITNPAMIQHALELLYPDPQRAPALPEETIYFRIRLTSKSGRMETPE